MNKEKNISIYWDWKIKKILGEREER